MFFPSSAQLSPTKKSDQSTYFFSFSIENLQNINLDDETFTFKPTTTTTDNRLVSSRQKPSPRNRTISATDTNQPISTFESLSINTQLTNNQNSRDTSPSLRARRFSGDIVLSPFTSTAEAVEPSLFSPGSVRARTINSIQENKNSSSIANRPYSLSNPPVVDPSSSKRLDIRLSSGKTVNTSDFVHSDHHPMNSQLDDQQQNQSANDTARNKLLQSVYINNTNAASSASLSEPLTNGTNSHTHPTESSSNCILS
jgi:hypothetical protein